MWCWLSGVGRWCHEEKRLEVVILFSSWFLLLFFLRTREAVLFIVKGSFICRYLLMQCFWLKLFLVFFAFLFVSVMASKFSMTGFSDEAERLIVVDSFGAEGLYKFNFFFCCFVFLLYFPSAWFLSREGYVEAVHERESKLESVL